MEADMSKVYVSMLVDALKRKKKILKKLYSITKEQERLLKEEKLDTDAFSDSIEKKNNLIDELTQVDEGFDRLFKSVSDELKDNKTEYKEEIESMKELINDVSESGVQIQALEQQNSGHFKVYLANQRADIKRYNVNKRTASTYYKNMTNVHKPENSYFINETQ